MRGYATAKRIGGVRLLPGRCMVIEQATAVPVGRGPPAQEAPRSYAQDMKAGGFMARSLQRHEIEGALAAPAA